MEEQWKEIPYTKGYYISNFGRVKIEKCHKYPNGVIKDNNSGFYEDKDGYFKLSYRMINGKSTASFIHRLVAQAFIDNHYNKKVVNHKDSDRKNNKVTNLEWCTAKENVYHAFTKGNRKYCLAVPKQSKLTPYQISQIDNLRQHYSLRKIADLYNISYTSMKNIVIRLKRLSHGNQQPSIYSESYHIDEGSTTIPNGSTLQANGSGNALPTKSGEDIV